MSEQTATQTVTETPIEYADHLTIACGVGLGLPRRPALP